MEKTPETRAAMKNINVIERIHSVYRNLTKAEKKVANYCLRHREEIPYLSISDLACACGVGDTSVFRFCRSLRFHGYQEFKMRFSLCAEEANSEDFVKKDDSDTIFNTMPEKIRDSCVSSIDEAFHLLNPNHLEKTVNLLEQAEHIYFFGVGDSLSVAEEAKNKFLRITQKVSCITDFSTWGTSGISESSATCAAPTTEKDLIFIISYYGAAKDSVQTAKLARENGTKVVCVTHFQNSPLAACCDAVLLCGAKENPPECVFLSEKPGILFLIDLLCQCYYERNRPSL